MRPYVWLLVPLFVVNCSQPTTADSHTPVHRQPSLACDIGDGPSVLDQAKANGYLEYRHMINIDATRFMREFYRTYPTVVPVHGVNELYLFKGEAYHHNQVRLIPLVDGCRINSAWSLSPTALEQIITNVRRLGVDG